MPDTHDAQVDNVHIPSTDNSAYEEDAFKVFCEGSDVAQGRRGIKNVGVMKKTKLEHSLRASLAVPSARSFPPHLHVYFRLTGDSEASWDGEAREKSTYGQQGEGSRDCAKDGDLETAGYHRFADKSLGRGEK